MGEVQPKGRKAVLAAMKGYKPFIIRTGLGYSYKISITFSLLWIILVATPLLLGGAPPLTVATDITIWLLPLIVLVMTWFIKNSIDEFALMFNLFGERADDSAYGVMRAFSTEEECDKYRHKLKKAIFSPAELILGAITVLGVLVLLPPYWRWDMVSDVYYFGFHGPFIIASRWITYALDCFGGLIIGVGMWIVLGIIRSVSLMGSADIVPWIDVKAVLSSRRPMTTQDRVSNLKRTMKFFEFHRSVREIGAFMYRFCLKLIIIALIWVVYAAILDFRTYQQIQLGTMLGSIALMLGIFALFIIPQFSIHNLLTKYKGGVMQDMDVAYEQVQSAFLESMYDQGYFKPGMAWKDRSEVREDSEVINGMISHVRSMGTWSFSFPTALKLLGAAALPLATAILQAFGGVFGIHL